eukprot:694903-Rhodomonas_salina.5
MPGTVIAYATGMSASSRPVLTYTMLLVLLLAAYTMPGTDYGATRLSTYRTTSRPSTRGMPICLRASYVMSGTDVANAASCLRAP